MDKSSLEIGKVEYEQDRIIFVGSFRTDRGPVVKFTLASGETIWQQSHTPGCRKVTRDLLEQYGLTRDGKTVPEMWGRRLEGIECNVSYERVLVDGKPYTNVNFALDGGHDEEALEDLLRDDEDDEDDAPIAKAAKTPSRKKA